MTRRAPARRRATPTTRRRPPATARGRVQVRSPVVVHRRTPRRRTVFTVGGLVVSLLGAVATITASLIWTVVTLAVAALTVALALLSSGDTRVADTQPDRTGPRPPPRQPPTSPRPAPVAGRCNAPTKTGGRCRRNVLTKPCPHHGAKGRTPAPNGGGPTS